MAPMTRIRKATPQVQGISVSARSRDLMNQTGTVILELRRTLAEAQQQAQQLQQHLAQSQMALQEQHARLVGQIEVVLLQAGQNPDAWEFDLGPDGEVILKPQALGSAAAPVPPVTSNGNHSQEEA